MSNCLVKTLQSTTQNSGLPVFGRLSLKVENPGKHYFYIDGVTANDVTLTDGATFVNASDVPQTFAPRKALYILNSAPCYVHIDNKYGISYLALNETQSDTVETEVNDVRELKYLTSLTKQVSLQNVFYGEVTEADGLKLLETSLAFMSYRNNLTLDFSKIGEFKAEIISIRTDNVTNKGGLDTVNPNTRQLQLNGTWTYGTTRNSSHCKVLSFTTLNLADEESLANYILTSANCAVGNTNTALSVNCAFTVTSAFLERTDIRNAVWKLMYNLYANVDDEERTSGTYYTSVKVNNVAISPLEP